MLCILRSTLLPRTIPRFVLETMTLSSRLFGWEYTPYYRQVEVHALWRQNESGEQGQEEREGGSISFGSVCAYGYIYRQYGRLDFRSMP